MQHTYRISKAAPNLSYLPRFINYIIFNRILKDLHICQNILKPTTLNCFAYYTNPEKPHLWPNPVPYPEFHLHPALLFSFQATVREYSVHRAFLKTLFRTPGTTKREYSSKFQQIFFSR